ncbi:phosphatidylglycerophosphatase A family protein [Fibrivirga algicola]|uniref:Phosphatidylglycerophosphatase A n=1 Tax=Fibrivirga algicola TaxID=2950420 RepID=A0ABX0QGJ9_9BACT|nr:phosphatidylglycerophosphatase A [Fibrivirga algicola]ARK09479.1 phosphatidylglycerophosphatase A [Fibrella sp. ES10-3-2-2]NID10356.1 phosphatidylglycerophosphatase A [Fibrivirga algicola]
MHKLIATGLGIGYVPKGGGTVASVVCCAVWYLTRPGAVSPGGYLIHTPVLVTVALTAVGIWSANVVEQYWGKDNYRVVIDELAGMCLTLLFIPITATSLLLGLVLFRFFDIAKPLGIRKLEKLSGGWGVMFDDLLAGLYANLVLRTVVAYSIL